MIKFLYEKVTGVPWTTGRSCTDEFGPTPGARYAEELATLTDAELMRLTPTEAAAYARAVRSLRAVERQEARRAPETVLAA